MIRNIVGATELYCEDANFHTVDKFVVPAGGIKSTPAIGLSYHSARLHRVECPYDNQMPELTIFPSQGL
jgi:hypothetical protein